MQTNKKMYINPVERILHGWRERNSILKEVYFLAKYVVYPSTTIGVVRDCHCRIILSSRFFTYSSEKSRLRIRI